nr:MAG TPA: restriction alleviation protein [Bacteriophage sp.]
MELLKCPFCGSDKLKVGHKTKFKDPWKKIVRMIFYVMCNRCHKRKYDYKRYFV